MYVMANNRCYIMEQYCQTVLSYLLTSTYEYVSVISERICRYDWTKMFMLLFVPRTSVSLAFESLLTKIE